MSQRGAEAVCLIWYCHNGFEFCVEKLSSKWRSTYPTTHFWGTWRHRSTRGSLRSRRPNGVQRMSGRNSNIDRLSNLSAAEGSMLGCRQRQRTLSFHKETDLSTRSKFFTSYFTEEILVNFLDNCQNSQISKIGAYFLKFHSEKSIGAVDKNSVNIAFLC